MYGRTPREILSHFYKENNLEEDGGNSSPSVKIEVTKKFHFYIPNFDSRRKAVLKHDIHHLLTDYTTSLADESAISAWEIASGCKKYWVAFAIDTSAVMIGILINFKGTLKAFARGRKTKNLYHDIFTNEQALDMKVSKLKAHFNLDKYGIDTKVTFTDFILFALFSVFGLVYSVLSLILLPFIIVYSIFIKLK